MEPVNMVAPILHGGTHKNGIYVCVLFGPCSALFCKVLIMAFDMQMNRFYGPPPKKPLRWAKNKWR